MGFVFACGRCERPLKGPAKPSSDSMFKCAICGQMETFENMKRIVAEFLKVPPLRPSARARARAARLQTRPQEVYQSPS
jgi:hypothetical protein